MALYPMPPAKIKTSPQSFVLPGLPEDESGDRSPELERTFDLYEYFRPALTELRDFYKSGTGEFSDFEAVFILQSQKVFMVSIGLFVHG